MVSATSKIDDRRLWGHIFAGISFGHTMDNHMVVLLLVSQNVLKTLFAVHDAEVNQLFCQRVYAHFKCARDIAQSVEFWPRLVRFLCVAITTIESSLLLQSAHVTLDDVYYTFVRHFQTLAAHDETAFLTNLSSQFDDL